MGVAQIHLAVTRLQVVAPVVRVLLVAAQAAERVRQHRVAATVLLGLHRPATFPVAVLVRLAEEPLEVSRLRLLNHQLERCLLPATEGVAIARREQVAQQVAAEFQFHWYVNLLPIKTVSSQFLYQRKWQRLAAASPSRFRHKLQTRHLRMRRSRSTPSPEDRCQVG